MKSKQTVDQFNQSVQISNWWRMFTSTAQILQIHQYSTQGGEGVFKNDKDDEAFTLYIISILHKTGVFMVPIVIFLFYCNICYYNSWQLSAVMSIAVAFKKQIDSSHTAGLQYPII